jgi:hypothetical protein
VAGQQGVRVLVVFLPHYVLQDLQAFSGQEKNHWQDALTLHLLRYAKVLWNLRRLPRDPMEQHQPKQITFLIQKC